MVRKGSTVRVRQRAWGKVCWVPTLERALLTAQRTTRYAEADDPIFATRNRTHQDSHNLRR